MNRKSWFARGLVLSALATAPLGAAGAVAPTHVTACPTTISVAGLYEVQTNLTATGTCITITGSDVTLGIAGNITGGGSGIGVHIGHGATRVVVRGDGHHAISGFGVGVQDDEGDAVIGDFSVSGNATTGLYLRGVNSVATTIDNIAANNNGHDGIHVTALAGVRGDALSANSNGTYGVWLDTGASGSVLANFHANNNHTTNVEIADSSNVIYLCRFAGGKFGVVVEKGKKDNIIVSCSLDGASPSVDQALDNNENCGTDLWFGNDFTAKNKPGCTGDSVAGGTAITRCETIDESGTYYLEENITATSGGDCIVVTATDVTLDMNGRVVTGKLSGAGLHVLPSAQGFHGFRGDRFTQFATGIEIDADGAVIEGAGGDANIDTGFFITGATVTLGKFSASNNGRFGLFLATSTHALIHDFAANSNGNYGAYLLHADHNVLNQFTAGNSGANGIAGFYVGCVITGPPKVCGIAMSSVHNVVSVATAASNTRYGWVLAARSDNNVMVDINADSNGNKDAYDGNSGCADNLWFFNANGSSNNPTCMNVP